MIVKNYILNLLLMLALCACSEDDKRNGPYPYPPKDPSKEYIEICDFENTFINFKTNDRLEYSVVDNPFKEEPNTSEKCGKVVSAGDMWELIWSEPVSKPFNFTEEGALFTVQIRLPKADAPIYFKLESSAGADAKEIVTVKSTVANQWETLEFDFTSWNLPDNVYDKIVMIFDAGVETEGGEEWFLDNIHQKVGEAVEPTPDPDPDSEYINYCNFENTFINFKTNDRLEYSIVDNPFKNGINTSKKCGKVVAAGDQWELIWSEPITSDYNTKFNFSKYGGLFTVKVYSPAADIPVYFKLESTAWAEAKELQNVKTTVANEWETLEFDFTSWNLPDETYDKVVIVFNAGVTTEGGEVFYFDDITGPNNKSESLMTRYENNPVLRYQGAPTWMCEHIANVAILPPNESPDGENWWMYARGSGYNAANVYHDQIGLFTQDAATFNPTGGWIANENNPIIPHGAPGTIDEDHLLDCAPVVGGDDNVYFYYHAKCGQSTNTLHSSLACRKSTDGGYTFGDPVKLLDGVGCSDAIYHNGKYYIYYGYGYGNDGYMKVDCAVTSDPMSFANAEITTVLWPGGGPANHDRLTVNGTRIFRLDGVNKWFMVYQSSTRYFDFPDRFHVAYSDDLLNWTKVDNTKPFFKRGDAKQWDQGGIWFGEVFEYNNMLYLYYEGWGCEGRVPDRDEVYFRDGHSSTGCASVSKDEFLEWCGLN